MSALRFRPGVGDRPAYFCFLPKALTYSLGAVANVNTICDRLQGKRIREEVMAFLACAEAKRSNVVIHKNAMGASPTANKT